MATVATAVISGKRQNNDTMISADNANIAQSGAIFVRVCDASVMPAPSDPVYFDFRVPYAAYVTKRLYSKACRISKTGWVFNGARYPSIVSRRQWRAVNTINSSASPIEPKADNHTSRAATASSLSTLVISKCWLKDGMNISELRVFSE